MIALRFTRLATLAWACALVAGSAPSAFAGIVYTMTNASGIQNGWELSGTITVSRTGTGLGSNAITNWAWTVTDGVDTRTFTSNDAGAGVNAYGLRATPTALIVPYASASAFQTPYLQLMTRSGSDSLDWRTGGGIDRELALYTASGYPDSFWQVQDRNPNFFPSTTVDGWVIGTVVAPVPEIDPAGIGSVLALVTGALGLLERRRLKTA